MTEQPENIARKLRDAYDAKEPIAPFREHWPKNDLDTAYAVQAINTEYWISAGRRVVGRKIGLTSRGVQAQLGVNQPDFGTLFADMEAGQDDPIDPRQLLQPRIEAEVALILGFDLPHADCGTPEVIRAVEYVVPALEIVDSRVRDWDIGIVDTIADNASSGMFVLGGPVRRVDGLDLHGCAMTMSRGGEDVSEGTGAACLGHPLNAAVWLARELARRGNPLSAGDLVLTGALGPMVPVHPGDHFHADIEGLGTVSALFSE